MKKKILTLMIATLFTVSGAAIQAKAEGQTSTTTATTSQVSTGTEVSYKDEAGVTPDSILYPIDKLIDEVQVIFTFTDGSKVETLLSNAEERLGESEVMAEAGNKEGAEEALKAYTETITEVNDKLDEVVKADADSEDTDKDEEVVKLEEATAEHQDSSIEILEDIKDEVGEDSEQILTKVIEMQIAKKAAVRAMVEARHELNDAKKEYNAAKVELKKAEKSGDEEAVKKAEEALKVSEENLSTEKVEYKTAFEAKQAAVKKYAGARNSTTEADKDEVDSVVESTTQPSSEAVESDADEVTNVAETTSEVTSDTTEATTVSEKVKEEKKAHSEEKKAEKKEVKKEDEGKNNSETKEKSEKAAEVQNSGKGNNRK
jgi:hypothetical protein